jgi:hypothetical protein
MVMGELEPMLARREAIAAAITAAIAQVGTLVAEEKALADQIRAALRAAGIKVEPLHTAPNLAEIINHELGRQGIEAWRVAKPFGPRLTDLVDSQHARARSLLATAA